MMSFRSLNGIRPLNNLADGLFDCHAERLAEYPSVAPSAGGRLGTDTSSQRIPWTKEYPVNTDFGLRMLEAAQTAGAESVEVFLRIRQN